MADKSLELVEGTASSGLIYDVVCLDQLFDVYH
jgi:hypothetical protein